MAKTILVHNIIGAFRSNTISWGEQFLCKVILKSFSKIDVHTFMTPDQIIEATANSDISVLFHASSAKAALVKLLSDKNKTRFEIAEKEKRLLVE